MPKYPLFLPPFEFANKPPLQWSAKEARLYFNWLLSIHRERIDGLLTFFEEPLTGSPCADLDRLGTHVAKTIVTPDFSRRIGLVPKNFKPSQIPPSREEISAYFQHLNQTGPKLTNAGYALAADMGLLVAKFLLSECGDRIKWSILKRPKSDMSYNLPVLIGFSTLQHLDPIGGSIAEAYGILRGNRGAAIWKDIFIFWKEKASQQ